MSTTALTAPATDHPRFSRQGRRWQFAWALIALAAAAVVGDGSIRTPTGPADGTTFCGESESVPSDLRLFGRSHAPRPFRVATFNIHGGKGFDGQRDFDRIAKCLEGLDFVALNEVHGTSGVNLKDNAEILGHTLGMSWLFAPTEHRWWHDHFGNGALSFYEVQSWQRIPLASHGSKSGRNALLAIIDAGQPIRALVTHIDRSDPQRSAQLRTVIDLFLALSPPAILLGDLNTTSADPLIQRLLAAPGAIDVLAGTSPGTGRIDWIVSRGLKCTARGMHPAGASDHPCFWAEFELPSSEFGGNLK